MQIKSSKTTIFLLTAGCFLSFFVFGFTDNLKGPTLPAMLAELNITYGTGGNIFFGEYLGFLIATLITGILADRFGLKSVILLAGVFLGIGVGGYSFFQSAILLSGSLFVLGMGLGALELGPNAIIVSLHHERKGLYLNLMAVLHGLGSLIAPLFAGWLLSINMSWRLIYRWDILLIALFVLIFIFLRFPKAEEKAQLDFRHIPQIAFKGQLPWFYAAITFYVAAEIGLASWLVTFLQETRNISVTASNQSLSLFFAMLMIGRLLGGFFVHRIGYLRSILFMTIGGIVCIATGLFGPHEISFLLAMTGFFLSIIFPTITAAVSDTHTENANTVLGVLFTFAGLGGVIGPWLIAWSSDLFGLQTGLSLIILFMLILLISVATLMKRISNGQNT
ncbi:MAG: MFS transporter [Anaerolineales bacterium]|uniref:MFS transporter n=1 Tax=Candidatus Villigracilis proximus TaxID=3140683 RepID=UPI003135B915|nr:MFS transporter [Anaerolineales bacterium]